MKFFRNVLFWLLLFVLTGIGACKHECAEIPGPEPQPCDTSNVSYNGSVVPIFNEYCISCHSGEQPAGNLDLDDYDQVSIVAQNGALVGSIRHLPGYSPMPKVGDPLDECQIWTIEIWIRDTTFVDPDPPNPCDPDTIYFERDLLPLLQSSCATTDCHDEVGVDGIRLNSYENVMSSNVVKPYEPGESDMYEVLIETDPEKKMPRPPSAPWSNDKIEIVYKWIEQGALNLFCEEDCDSVNVTFSEVIWPKIIDKSCFGCHSGASPSGGIKLENYTDVRTAALIPPGTYGSLLGVVSHATGNSPMPKNALKLSDCKIAQIRKWIIDGTPNN